MSDEAPPSPAVRLALVGPQGPYFNFVCTLLRHLFISHQATDYREFWLMSASDTQDFVAAEQSGPFLIGCHAPRPLLYEWLARNRILTIAVLDHPYRSVSYQMDVMNSDHLAATPVIAQGLAALGDIALLPLKVVLTPENGMIRLSEFLLRLSRAIFGHVPDDIDNLLQRLHAERHDTVESAMLKGAMPADLTSRISEAALADVSAVCEPLVAMLAGQLVAQFNWPISFFLDGKLYKRPAAQVVELVGPARCLFYGPYLYLPRGRYQGEVAFGLSAEIRDTYLRIEVARGADITELVARAKEGGIYTMPFDLEILDGCQELEIRIMIDRGEIEGRFALAYVRFRPENGAAS